LLVASAGIKSYAWLSATNVIGRTVLIKLTAALRFLQGREPYFIYQTLIYHEQICGAVF